MTMSNCTRKALTLSEANAEPVAVTRCEVPACGALHPWPRTGTGHIVGMAYKSRYWGHTYWVEAGP